MVNIITSNGQPNVKNPSFHVHFQTLMQEGQVVNEPSCLCGYHSETAKHFFLECPRYRNIRHELLNSISNIVPIISLQPLLHGDVLLPKDENTIIFDAVHKFITD